MKMKHAICRGRARTVEDAVEAWKDDHDAAMQARDTEDLVDISLEFTRFLLDWVQQSWERLFANNLRSIQETGLLLQRWLTRADELAKDVENCIRATKKQGYTVEGADEFAATVANLRRIKQDFEGRWPFVDENVMEDSRLAFQRGEGQDVEDLIRETQG
jgi:hypothetical protein